jgi:excisionase family DNA binding protein
MGNMANTTITLNQKENQVSLDCLGNSPYTIPEAALLLRMSVKSVRRQIDRGNLRRCKAFGRILIPRKDVDSFIEKFSAYSFD